MPHHPGNVIDDRAYGVPVHHEVDRVAAVTAERSGFLLAARILLAAIFLMSGFGKLADIPGTVGYMSSQGIPAADILVYLAAAAEILGGLAVLTGFATRLGAAVLGLFLIPTTLLFHDFWAFEGQEMKMQMINFMKNVAIMGGLLALIAAGPGRYSVDALVHRRPLRA